jgi:hypothetical protein
LKKEIIEAAFYAKCSSADIETAKTMIAPQAVAPLTTAVRISDENFGKVRKVYITTLQDQALLPEAQAIMFQATPCDQLITIESDHSPFLSVPGLLAEHLNSV